MTSAVLALAVLPLGDSITEGVPTPDGYRAHLRTELLGGGIALKYLGSLVTAAGPHEGWSGYTAEELIPPLRAALARARPDLVLLHIGTNDLGLGVPTDRAAANVRTLLTMIDERSRKDPAKPPIRVLLALIIRRGLGPGRDHAVGAYNERLRAVAAERKKAGQAVELVDMSAVVDPAEDLADALHPNDRGYRKIARAWAEAIRRIYRR